ncbi:hypothetical protein BAE44_0019954, partial [Dichanthelium oligosanthes]
LTARNWPCNLECVLCDQIEETATHLCLHCCFAREVWVLIRNWTGQLIPVPGMEEEDVEDWWNKTPAPLSKAQQRSTAAVLMYTALHIWKERNRRVFVGK